MVFHWSLCGNKFLKVSRTLFSILADLSNSVVGIVTTCSLNSKSSSLCTNGNYYYYYYYYNYYYYYYYSLFVLFWDFFISALVSPSLQDSSQYSGRSQLCRSLDVLHSSYYLYCYYYSLIRGFHISVSRWFFTGVWVTASLLKSPGLFLVFWPFSIMLSFII